METSRRLARGRMAAVFGTAFVASDKEVLQSAYTDDELQGQYDGLGTQSKAAIDGYVRGVNAYISQATASNTLPEGYAKNDFKPEPWTRADTEAIAIRLFQLFGRGGAGELRDMALLDYLQGQPNAKGKVLDILDDFAWQNDPAATPTVTPGDDPLSKSPPRFPIVNRQITEKHLAGLPKLGLFELIPAIRLAENDESKRIGEILKVPFKTGSYCTVVGPSRSATGRPLLLSGPQMGHTTPAIIHETSMSAPGLSISGIDVPGVPGIAVGMTPNFAWGLTTGAADTEDIFYFATEGTDSYRYGSEVKPLTKITNTFKVKGGSDQTVVQQRTIFGPVVLSSTGSHVVFARRSSFWNQELKSLEAFVNVYQARTPDEIETAMKAASMNFNFFYATPKGDIGYRYLGRMPIRAEGLDPRFPTPAEPQYDWKGMVPQDQMPHVRNPKSGLLANWNNKPATWWPNLDTPTWGEIFRNTALLSNLEKPKLNQQDLEFAAWNIARQDENFPYFKNYIAQIAPHAPGGPPQYEEALEYLKAFDGRLMDGSISARVYLNFFNQLRTELFVPTTGNFLDPSLFSLVAQPTVMLNALRGKMKANYLGKRTVSEVVTASFKNAVVAMQKVGPNVGSWRLKAGGFAVPGEPPVPYGNRGSYIQIVDLMAVPNGMNIVAPGEAETGPHSLDQVPMARAWTYKPFGFADQKH